MELWTIGMSAFWYFSDTAFQASLFCTAHLKVRRGQARSASTQEGLLIGGWPVQPQPTVEPLTSVPVIEGSNWPNIQQWKIPDVVKGHEGHSINQLNLLSVRTNMEVEALCQRHGWSSPNHKHNSSISFENKRFRPSFFQVSVVSESYPGTDELNHQWLTHQAHHWPWF